MVHEGGELLISPKVFDGGFRPGASSFEGMVEISLVSPGFLTLNPEFSARRWMPRQIQSRQNKISKSSRYRRVELFFLTVGFGERDRREGESDMMEVRDKLLNQEMFNVPHPSQSVNNSDDAS